MPIFSPILHFVLSLPPLVLVLIFAGRFIVARSRYVFTVRLMCYLLYVISLHETIQQLHEHLDFTQSIVYLIESLIWRIIKCARSTGRSNSYHEPREKSG